MKIPVILLVLLFACVALAQPERTQASRHEPLEISISGVFGERSARWPSVCVLVTNKKRERFEGELRLRIESYGLKTQAYRQVVVEAGGKKRFFFYLFHEAYWDSDVAVEAVLTGKTGVSTSAWGHCSSGTGEYAVYPVISRTEGRTHHVDVEAVQEGFNLSGYREGSVERADVSTLPDHWLGYVGAGAVILDDAPVEKMTPRQQEALLTYAEQGGAVVVVPGSDPNWFRTPFAKRLLGVTAVESQEMDAGRYPELQGYLQMTSTTRFYVMDFKTEPVVHGLPEGGTPLMVSPSESRQNILVMCFEEPRLNLSREARALLWRELVRVRLRQDLMSVESLVDKETLVQNMTSLPSAGVIVLLLIAYIIAVGPANYFTLRRMRREPLLPVTILAISIFFVGLFFVVGFILRGVGTNARLVTVLRVNPGSTSYIQYDHLCVIPSFPTSVSVEAPEESALMSLTEGEQRPIRQDGRFSFENYGLGMWEPGAFVSVTPSKMDGGFKIEWRGTEMYVKNSTRFHLEHVVFRDVDNYSYRLLGDLPPGKTVKASEKVDWQRVIEATEAGMKARCKGIRDVYLRSVDLGGRRTASVMGMLKEPVPAQLQSDVSVLEEQHMAVIVAPVE